MKKVALCIAISLQLMASESNVATLTDVKESVAVLIKKVNGFKTQLEDQRVIVGGDQKKALEAIGQLGKEIEGMKSRLEDFGTKDGYEKLSTAYEELAQRVAVLETMKSESVPCSGGPCAAMPEHDARLYEYIGEKAE